MIAALLPLTHPPLQVAQQLSVLPELQQTAKSPRESSSTLRQGSCSSSFALCWWLT